MDTRPLSITARTLVADGKGLLAMDESVSTLGRRFARLGIPETVEARRRYRELIVTAPGLGDAIGGAILHDETMRQRTNEGVPFLEVLTRAGITPGIKVDLGTTELAGSWAERVTEGLDGLRARLVEYVRMGARFAKWRAVFGIGDAVPSRACIEANALGLARYAALCQEAGLLPIVEPEVLMDGSHTLARSAEVTERVLRAVFANLYTHRVALDEMILKPNMVLAGSASTEEPSAEDVADATVGCLRRAVPAAVPVVAFLSGGQPGELAAARLSAMQTRHGSRLPWTLTFSFARAIQDPALTIWAGDDARRAAAQEALVRRARLDRDASRGRHEPSLGAFST